MKIKLTIISLMLYSFMGYSQTIVDDLIWAKKISSNGLTQLLIETDNNNNIFLTGVFLSCPNCYIGWGSDSLYFQGNYSKDIFLAKLDSNGNLLWNKLIAGNGDELISGFKVDNNNNIILYVLNDEAFNFSGTNFDIGNNLLKLDENGELLWAENIDGAQNNSLSSIFLGLTEQVSITCNDEIIIGGSIQKIYDYDVIVDTIVWGLDTMYEYLQIFDTLKIAGQTFTIDTNNIFIAKFGPQGDLNWLKTFEHTGELTLSSLDASKNQEINVLGFFQNDDWAINGQILPIDTIGSIYKRNIFVIKLDISGEIIWVNKYFDNIYPNNLTTDKSGGIIGTGTFYPTTYYGIDTLKVGGLGGRSIIFKIDSIGNYQWATNKENLSAYNSHRVLINNSNEVYFSGDINPHLGPIMHKYSASGQLLWILNPTQSSNRDGGDIAFDNSGNLIQTGLYSGPFKIGNYTLPYDFSGHWHQFILKFKAQSAPGTNIYCEETSSMPPINESSSLQIYPNPTSGTINVSLHQSENEKVHMELFDNTGRLLEYKDMPSTLNLEYKFNIDSLPSGWYVLKLTSNNFVESRLIFLNKFTIR